MKDHLLENAIQKLEKRPLPSTPPPEQLVHLLATRTSIPGQFAEHRQPQRPMQLHKRGFAPISLVDLDRRLQRLESGGGRPKGDPGFPRDSPFSSQGVPSDQAGSDDRLSFQQQLQGTAPSEPSQTFLHHAVNMADKSSDGSEPAYQASKAGWTDFFGYQVDMMTLPPNLLDRQSVALPLQHFADDLLHVYWRQIHTIYPFLHWPTFMAKYAQLWNPSAAAERTSLEFEEVVFHATLNMALALGCQTSESMSQAQRQYQANEFYKQSQRLVSIETLDASSLSIVQLLLLRSLYLYYAGLGDRCWVMVGAAFGVAVGLGLQASQLRKGDSQMEREMRLRVWYFGLNVMDHTASSAFGRPSLVNKLLPGPPLPQEIDDEYLSATEEGRQPPGLPARAAFNLYWKRVANVIDDMRAMRASNQSSSGSLLGPDPSAILRLNSRIEDLLQGVPSHLRAETDLFGLGLTEEQVAVFRYQGRVFRTRTLLLRMLLLRPSLLAEAQRRFSLPTRSNASSTAQLDERFQAEICGMCITTAHSVLEEMNQHIGTALEYPGWYAVQLSFNAATILIAASICPSFHVHFDVEPARSSWDRAVRILEIHKERFPSAARGLQVLHGFRSHVASRLLARVGFAAGANNSAHQQQHAAFPPAQHVGIGTGPPLDNTMGSYAPGTMPMAGIGNAVVSAPLDQSWMTVQDFGQNDWMLRYPTAPEDRR